MKLSSLFTLGLVAADRLDRKEVDVNALDRLKLGGYLTFSRSSLDICSKKVKIKYSFIFKQSQVQITDTTIFSIFWKMPVN